MSQLRRLEKRLAKQLRKTSESWSLLAPGDHIMVAVSGGKDSYTLLVLLEELRRRLPFPLQLTAVHLDQAQPGYEGSRLVQWLSDFGVPFEILREDTYSVVLDKTKEGGTYCALCSRLRRGILYTAAERLGCNKIALGHHREDTLETFLLNLFFAGKLQAMPAKYTTDDGQFEVIRPLIDCDEREIAEFAALSEFPILPCNLCGSQPSMQRDAMGALLDRLEATHPNVRGVMMHALSNVRSSHLLDASLIARLGAMEGEGAVERDDEGQKELIPRRRAHNSAMPILRGGRLPVL